MADGWIVRGTSRLGPPIDITTRVAEVDYDLQWRPKSLLIDGIVRGQDVTLKTTFDGTQASNVLAVQGAPQSKADAVSADPVVLPNTFLGSYAALARRLQGKTAGSELRGYIAPQAEITIRVMSAAPERIETPKGVINATRYAMTFNNPPPAGDLAVNLWADADGGLLRMNIPTQMIEMAREDIASAASRTAAFSIPGDESVLIPSLGFNLAATITRPTNATATLPAVILIAGSGPTDRDETVAGIPVFGHIARDLVAAGFAVVRYDKRGVGQSGGRAESATIADYAEDARQVLLWLEKQKGIDKNRIALVGHSEGGLVAMLTAGRERGKVAAMALLATPSASGNEIVLEQQKHMLSKMPIDDAQRAGEDRAAGEDQQGGDQGHGLGGHSRGGAARRRHAVVLQLPDLQSREGDGRHAPAGVDRAGRARRAGDAASRRQARADGARAQRREGAGRGREGAGRQSPARAGQDRRGHRVRIARPGREGLAAGHAAIATFLTKVLKELSLQQSRRAPDPHHRPRSAGR